MKTIIKRFFSPTPAFFRWIQAFGATAFAAGKILAAQGSVPANITTILLTGGISIAAVAQFAQKESAPGTKVDDLPSAT
jgi:hypothetical protein